MDFKVSLFLAIMFIGSLSEAAIAREEQFVICKQSKLVRTIRALGAEKDDGCRAFYSKDGAEKQVGQGRFTETCNKIIQNVRTNLEAANWRCKDVRHSSTDSEPSTNKNE